MYQIKDSVEFSVFEFHAINIINKLKSFFKKICVNFENIYATECFNKLGNSSLFVLRFSLSITLLENVTIFMCVVSIMIFD